MTVYSMTNTDGTSFTDNTVDGVYTDFLNYLIDQNSSDAHHDDIMILNTETFINIVESNKPGNQQCFYGGKYKDVDQLISDAYKHEENGEVATILDERGNRVLLC